MSKKWKKSRNRASRRRIDSSKTDLLVPAMRESLKCPICRSESTKISYLFAADCLNLALVRRCNECSTKWEEKCRAVEPPVYTPGVDLSPMEALSLAISDRKQSKRQLKKRRLTRALVKCCDRYMAGGRVTHACHAGSRGYKAAFICEACSRTIKIFYRLFGGKLIRHPKKMPRSQRDGSSVYERTRDYGRE